VLEAAESRTFFPLRIDLICERNTSCKSYFQGGERLIFFQIGLFSYGEESLVSLKGKSSSCKS
jgi:hypothetical protein